MVMVGLGITRGRRKYKSSLQRTVWRRKLLGKRIKMNWSARDEWWRNLRPIRPKPLLRQSVTLPPNLLREWRPVLRHKGKLMMNSSLAVTMLSLLVVSGCATTTPCTITDIQIKKEQIMLPEIPPEMLKPAPRLTPIPLPKP